MANEEIAPVKHGMLSTAGTTAAETAKGGLYGALKGVGIAAAIAAGVVGGGALLISGSLAAAAWFAGGAALVSLVAAPYTAGAGLLFGGVTGASRGLRTVSQEHGAATSMEMQIEAMKAQSQAMAAEAQMNRNYGMPSQGSTYNQAASKIDASTINHAGMAAGPDLSAARGA